MTSVDKGSLGYTVPFGTVEEVRLEVADDYRIFSKRGLILAPCHNI